MAENQRAHVPWRASIPQLLRRLFARRSAWLVLLLTIPAMLPLFRPGYFFNAHDARQSVFFLVEFDQAFRAGALWPIWVPDFAVGFGYPLWLVYAPLPLFVGEAFHLLGLGFVAAVKATWALGFVLGALGMYRLARHWWGPAAGVVASVAFTYAPYHLVQIYVRAALAEFLALAWLPWTVLALAALWKKPGPRRAASAALAVGILLMLHTASLVTFVPLVAGLMLVLLLQELKAGRQAGHAGEGRRPVKRVLLWSAAGIVLGGLLAAIFLAPLLLEQKYIVVEGQWINALYSYRNHFVYPGQFLDPSWGYGYSVPGPDDGMSFQLGWALLLAAGAGAVLALRRRTPRLPHRAEAFYLIAASIGAVFLMMPVSVTLWDALPLIELIQFPWRLLAVEVFALALLAGVVAHRLEPRSSAAALLLAACLTLASSFYIRADMVPSRPQDELPVSVIEFELKFSDMRGMTRWSERIPLNEDSPLIDQYLAGEPLRRAAIVSGEGRITAQDARPLSAQAQVQAAGPVRLRFYTYYFPGWRATLDGQPVEIAPDPPNGLIGLDVPAGEHQVVLRFGPTPIRRASAALSAATLLGIAALALLRPRSRLSELAETEM